MKNLKSLSLAAVAAFGLASHASELVLWPSDLTEMKAQSDSKIAPLPDGSMSVVTGTQASWPGMRMDFKAGEMDLSAYGRITIAISNTTDKTRTVSLSVKGRTHQGQSPGGNITLKPHAAGELKVNLRNMPWILDAPLKLEGMNGRPSAKGGTTFDLRATHSFHIFYNQDGVASGFSVKRVSVSGEGVQPKTLKAATFLPFVDKYGQFKHDDWPGKIHNDAELQATREREDAWLAKNGASPIPDADKYGGWAAGPQLKATGFFRTEKVNGKWWLVDPEGRLFFSHGVDCVRHGNGSTGVGFRESYFEWIPAKDDPQFGRFRGRVTWPAAHNFYKDPAHVPYDTFDFSSANLLRKYGANWREESKDRAHRRIRAWGLNTIANWSLEDIYLMRRTPYTLCLGTHGTPRLKGSTGWWGALPDPFTKEFEAKLRERARGAAKKMKDDPWCIGVFVDNELSWNREERMKEVAEQYFTVVKKVLKEELPNHLYLGCRIAWGTEVIYRAAARHCDVVSVNIYNRQPVGRDLPADAEDKPLINGEFHFGALDRGMFHTGLVGTRDQNERAQCYRDFVNACLDHPRFVGTHWFQWQDQALTGRGDGENYQIGFLNVSDTPYPELVQAARDVAATMYARRYGDPTPVAPTAKRELFNGKDLTNWYTFLQGRGKNVDPDGVFSVKDGILHVTGKEFGGLTTEEAFKDYKLTVEYRWVGTSYGGKKTKALDSGILFHSVGPDGGFGGIWMLSHEYNLIFGASGDFWTVSRKDLPGIYLKAEVDEEKLGGKYYIYKPGGREVTLIGNDRVCRFDIARDWTDTPQAKAAVNEGPVGSWNTATLVCRGDTVECWFNGKLVNRATQVRPAGGRIQLQSELCGIEFRRVTIEPCN